MKSFDVQYKSTTYIRVTSQSGPFAEQKKSCISLIYHRILTNFFILLRYNSSHMYLIITTKIVSNNSAINNVAGNPGLNIFNKF